MNKVFAAFWYSNILRRLFCTDPTTTIPTTTTTTTTFENHESLSQPQSAKKAKIAGMKAKQQQNQSFEKELQLMLQQLRIEKEQTEELLKAREETLKMKEEELEARGKEREKLQKELKKLQKMKEFKPTMNRERARKERQKKGCPQITWLKDHWRKSKKEKDQQPMSAFLAFTTEAMKLLEEEQYLQLKEKEKDPLKPKQPMSAFLMLKNERRAALLAESKGVWEVGEIIGGEWNNMT
ncbi:high mobility group B protein 6-like [Camellia sinensis]|uniref:high mobility group B protein 6-like n=1 Tax=Camellia sinensis TaxID=4442 RepID=UPI001035CBE9|nr:high mobility group B protein 6-like [Camellia sinensis]